MASLLSVWRREGRCCAVAAAGAAWLVVSVSQSRRRCRILCMREARRKGCRGAESACSGCWSQLPRKESQCL